MGVFDFFKNLFSGNNSSTPVNTNTNTSDLSGTNKAQNGSPRVSSTPTKSNTSSYNLAGTNNIQNAGGTARNTPKPSEGPYLPNANKPVSTNPYESQVNAKKYQKELSKVADESNKKAQSVLNTIGKVTGKAGEVVKKISDTGKANQDYYTQRQQNLKAKSLKENQDRRDNDVKSITQDEMGKMYNTDGSQTDLDTREKELKEAITSVRMNMSGMDQENFNLIDYEYQNNQLQSLQEQLDEVQNLKRKRESLEENYILGQMRATGDPNLEGYEEMLSHKEDNLAERFGTSMAHLLTTTANEIPSIIDQAIYASNFDPAKKNIEELVEKNKNGELSDDALAEAYALYEKDILEYKDRFDASVSQAVNDVANQLNSNTFYGADDIEKFVLQAGESTAQFLLHYAVGTAIAGNFVNGLEAVRDAGGQIATGTMSLASTTDKFNQLIAQGYDPDIAMKNAVATGLVSYMVEKVGMDRFVEMLGTPVSVDAMGEIIKNVLQSGVSEGLEEVVESMIDTVVDNSILGEYEFSNSELLMEFLLGGASGLAMATGATARSAVDTAIETFQNVNAYVEANANLRDALVEQVRTANTEASEFVVKTRHQRNSLQNQMNLLRERMSSMTDTQKAVAVQEIEKAMRSIRTYDSMTATAGITLQEDIAEPIIPGENDKLVLESWSINFNNDVQAMNRLNELQAEVVQNAEDLKVKRAEADEKTQAILDENGYDIDATAFNNLSDEGKKKALASIDFARAIGIELELVDNLDPLENGKFVNGKVVLDISKTIKGKSTIISTLAHELTHRNEYSKSFYPKLKEIVQKHLGDMWDSAVQNKILDYENAEKELTLEEAEKEVVAGAIEDLFENEDFLDDLIRYDYSFIERSLQGLRNIVGNTYENKVKRAFEKAFKEVNEKSIVFTENKAQMSVGQYDHNGRELFSSYLDDKIEKGQLTEDDKKDILKRLDEIAQVMRDFEATGEFPATSNWNDQFYEIGENGDLSVVISNGDYDLNIDFSTVCKKRKMMDKVLNQLAKAGYLTKKLTDTQLETLREVIKENELEVACGLCFVDAKRFNQGNWAGKFELKWNGIIDHIAGSAGIEDISYFDFAHGKVGVSEQLANLVISEDDPRFSELFSEAQGNSEKARMIRAIINDPSLRSKVTSQDMYGSESFGAMKELKPSLYKLVNASGGASKPKLPHAEINYRHEIAFSNKFNEESARRVGGVRCQSFSDFMVNMVFDYMEMFADLEAKNLPAHSYTKVKEYGLIFGKTGMKINLSIIPAGFDKSVYTAEEIADIRKNDPKLYKQLRENAGLDANGNYIFDEESFGESKDKENGYGWKLAIEMQNLEGYDKNVGTICVGVSDKHIFKLLADPDVCMIIPYHRSGIDSVIAEKMGVHVFNDYTLKQNTRFRKANGKPGTKVGSGFEFDFYGGSDFNGKHFSGMIENGYDAKKTADQYLDWCKEHNYVPKFDTFAGDPNYYKLLIDFRAYDKNGNIAPQEAVNISKDESIPSFSDVIDATKNPELFEMYGDNIAFENVLQNGLRAYEDTDALQNEKLDPITEEFIRRAKLTKNTVGTSQNSVAGDVGLKRLEKWLTDTDANGDLVNGNNPKYADIQAKYKEMTAKRAEARQMRDAFLAGDYQKYGLTYADVTTLINNARYMPDFERERRGNYPTKLKINDENLKRAVLEEVIRQKTGWIMPMDPREKRGEGAEFYDDGLIDRLAGYLMGQKIVGPAPDGSSVPFDPSHPTKKCDYGYPGEFKDPSLKKIGDFDDSGLIGIMYPDAMNIPVKAYNDFHNPGSCGYTHIDYMTGYPDGIAVNQTIGSIENKDTMAHEIQHVIQTAEQWQNGAGLSGRSEQAWSKYLNTPGERDARAEGWRQVHDADRYDPNKPWVMPQPTPAPANRPQAPQAPQAPQLSPPYLYKGPDSGRTAQVLDEAPERKKSNWKDFFKKIKHDYADHLDRIEELSRKYKNPKLIAKADFAMLAPAFANDALFNKRHKIGTSDEIGESLQSILDKVKPEDMQTFGEFMYHYRNLDATSMVQRLGKEYMAEKFIKEHGVMGTFNSYANPQDFLYYIDEAERTLPYEELMKNKTYVAWKQFLAPKPVFGRAITNAESQARIDEILAQHPEYNDIAEQLWEYETQNLDVLKDAGVLTQEMYDQFRKETPHYVPIQRAVNSEYNGADSMDPNKAIKKFKGSDQDIYPLAYNMVKHTYDVYKTALQNNLHAEIYNTLKQPKGTTITSETDSEEDNEIMDADAVVESLNDNFVPIEEQEKGHYKMYAYINGERKRVGISKELYDSLSPRRVDTPDIPLANTISEFRRNLITSYSLPFMFSNFFKDMQDAGYNTKYSLPKYYANYVRAFGEVFGDGKMKKLYLANGGGESSYFHEIGDRKERSNWNPLKHVIWLNDQVEMIPRLAEFMCAQQAGKSIEESMYEASEVTTNFKRGGAKAKYLNRNGVTFFNASIQGFEKQIRNIKDAKDGGAKAMATYMAKIALLSGMPLALLNGLVWRDDKEYEELSDYVKENYYIVGKVGNRFIRIPKGRLSAFYQTVMTNGIKTVKGQVDVWDALVDSVQSFADNIAPNNPSDNFILSPLLQAYGTPEGRTWYHEDLVPSNLQNRLKEDQYDASTDIVSIWIGKQLKASPYKINYVLDQYTGGVGDIALPMLALQANNGVNNKFLSAVASPWIDKFSTDPVLKNQNVSGLYTLKDELGKATKSVSATEDQLLSYKYLSVVSGKMGELYTKIKEVQADPSLSNGEKYEKVRELKKQINDFAREGLNNYDQIDINGDYAEVGGVQYYKDKNGEWKKMSESQVKNIDKTGLDDVQKGAYYESYNAIQEAREKVKDSTPEGQDADYRQVTIDLIKDSNMDAKTKNVMFDYYYPSKFTEAVNSMDFDDETKLNVKFVKTMAEGKKDANGKTISNSKALATADAYADMGVLEDIIKYIKDNDIDPSTMGLSKTVLGYSYKQLASKYQQVFNEVFGDGKPFDTGSSGSSSGKGKKSSSKSGKSSKSGSKQKKTKTPTGKHPKAYNMVGKLGIDYKPKLVNYNSNYANAYANTMRKTRPGSNDLVTCPKCGNRVSARSGRCPICGAQL